MKGYIYKVTNTVNGKSYIGQTRYTVEHRWDQHKAAPPDCHFHRAIKKYGVQAFELEILEECDYADLDARELFYIAKYNTFFNGYNSTIGNIDRNNDYSLAVIERDNIIDDICCLYESGLSTNKIAVVYNIDKGTVSKILKTAGIKLRDKKQIIFTPEEFKEVVYDYQHGFSIRSLAKRYDCSPAGLKEYLFRNNIDLRKKYSILDNEEEQQNIINDYLDNNTTLKQILKKYHCDYKTFCKILAKHGISKGKKHFKLSDAEALECIRMFNTGVKIPQIAKKFKVDKGTVYSLFKRYGINYLTV